jgi:hypothetical protein
MTTSTSETNGGQQLTVLNNKKMTKELHTYIVPCLFLTNILLINGCIRTAQLSTCTCSHPSISQSVVCENLAKRQKDSATAFSKKAKKQASASGTAVTL